MENEVITDAYTIEVDRQNKLCIVTGNEEVNFEKTMEVFELAENIPELYSDFSVIADMRSVNYHPTFEEIMTIKNRIVLEKDALQGKVALLTAGRITILADLICAFSRAAGINMKSFRNMENARKWIHPDDNS